MWPHRQSVFDEIDRGNWADCWFYRTRVGTRVGHTGPGAGRVSMYLGINIPN